MLPANSLPGWEAAKNPTVSLPTVLACATDSIPPLQCLWSPGREHTVPVPPTPTLLLEELWATSGHEGALQLTTDIQSCWNLSWSSGIAQTTYIVLHPPLLLPTPHLPPVKRCHIHWGLTVRRGGGKTTVKFLTSSGFTQSPLETAAWGRFRSSPCFRCRHLVAQSLAAALVCALATPGPVLAWNNQSLPSLLPRALLLRGGEAQLLASPLPWGMCHGHGLTHTGSHTAWLRLLLSREEDLKQSQ